MANDIFGAKEAVFGKAFAGDAARLHITGFTDVGRNDLPTLVQGMNFGYQQEVTRLYNLGSQHVFYVRGRAQGTGQLQQVLGPAALQTAFMQEYGSVCNVGDHTLTFVMSQGCEDVQAGLDLQGEHQFVLKFVVLQSLTVQMQVQDMLIQNGISFIFSAMTAGKP